MCDALFDPVPQVIIVASDALKKVDPKLYPYVAILMDGRTDLDWMTDKMQVVSRIRKLGIEAAPAIPVLVHFKQQAAAIGMELPPDLDLEGLAASATKCYKC